LISRAPCNKYSGHSFVLSPLAYLFQDTTTKMADLGKRKGHDSRNPRKKRKLTLGSQSQSESQQSDLTLKPAGEDFKLSEADEIFNSILATLPPVHQWSSAAIKSLRSAVNENYPKAKWQEESEWTRRVLNTILASNEGWNWQRLKICSNEDYFSLPTHVSHTRSPQMTPPQQVISNNLRHDILSVLDLLVEDFEDHRPRLYYTIMTFSHFSSSNFSPFITPRI